MQQFTCTLDQHSNFQDLKLNIGTLKGFEAREYTIPRDNWIQFDNGTCTIKFMYNSNQPKWILGLNFFRDYFVEFSSETGGKYVSLWKVPIG